MKDGILCMMGRTQHEKKLKVTMIFYYYAVLCEIHKGMYFLYLIVF